MKKEKPTWGSGGKRIPYPELSDEHLKAILKDGYRNPHLREEALHRNFNVPERPVEKLTIGEVLIWVESFASTALSGDNKFAEKMVRLWDEDKQTFYLLLNKFIEDQERNLAKHPTKE